MHGLIPAPSDPNKRSVWREHLHAWRSSTRHLLNYDDSLYCAPEFAWIPRCYTLAVVMMNDLQFYDGGYRLDAFLDEAEEAFGGFDAVLLWHAYPRIGFDDRNQFDFYRQMPGDLAGLRSLVDQCHQRNVRVYVDYNPWDTGTRREHQSDIEALVELVQAIDADAIFLDTMSHAAAGLREKLDAVRPGVTLESEVLVPLEHLDTHPSSWAQGFADGPGVLRNKWFERRHMQHRVKRWQHDHTPELHTAWMNGAGMIVWENVFGSLVAWCERDKSILRAMSAIQRRYHHLFCGERWTPLTPTLHNTVDASLWEDDTTRLWTLVNHSEQDISGEFIAVPFREGERYYAPVQGDSIMPTVESGQAVLKGRIRARGIGAFLATSQPPANMPEFLGKLAALETRANFDATPPPRIETLRSAPKTKLYAAPLPNLAAIPAHDFDMRVTFTIRECGFYEVPNIVYPDLRFHNLHREWSMSRRVSLPPYALDLTPVTNRQFDEFLRASGYIPPHPENFLLHWVNERIPDGLEEHPVVYVSLEDARAYADWAGKRLPTEAEWQFAAQGFAAHRYPWGDEWQPDACNYGQVGGTTPVKQFPQGRSPFGCYDLCGNVWEWTESERSDGRNRFAILKGGSFYRAEGSAWYADGGAKPNDFAAKFLLMYPGLDRCATIGLRCAVDFSE